MNDWGRDRSYAGPDRRRRGLPPSRLRVGVAVAAGAGLLLAVGGSAGAFGDLSAATSPGAREALMVLATAGAFVLAVLCAIVWHVLGRAASAWLAAAMATYGLGVALLGLVEGQMGGAPMGTAVLSWVRPSARLVVIGLLVAAAVSPPVVSLLRPLRALLLAVGATAVLTVALQLAPTLLPALSGTNDVVAVADGEVPIGSAVLILLWGAAGVLMAVQARRRDEPMLGWGAVLALMLAMAEVLRQPEIAAAGEASGDLLRSGALAIVAVGVGGLILSLFADQRGELLTSQVTAESAQARLADLGAATDELRHEARNALSAIGMATGALQHSHELLDPASRSELSAAIAAEIDRLSALLDQRPAGAATAVRVTDVVAPQAAAARAGGTPVTVDLDKGLTVVTDRGALAQAVANLLSNARRHAPGSPVTLRAAADDGGVVLRCEDEGPGVPVSERQRIFDRGVRGRAASADGRGLGLHVAERLVRRQGGAMWVDDRPGGGASFAIWLPAPRGPAPKPTAGSESVRSAEA